MSKRGPTVGLPIAPESQNVNTTEILFAAASGDSEQVKWLYKLIADDVAFNANVRMNGLTPLMVAAAHSGEYQVQVIEQLLNLGADIHARNASGETALAIAKKNNNHEAVKALYKYSSLESSYFDWLPDTVFSNITHFLPAYSYMGNNAIRQVCQYWNLDETVTQTKTIEDIINACAQPEDVIAILKDEQLRAQLSSDQFVKLISIHPALSFKLLNKIHLLHWSQICILAQGHESVAQKILDILLTSNAQSKQVQGLSSFCSFAGSYLSIAQRLMHDEALKQKLDGEALSYLGEAHLSIAEEIFATPALLLKLDSRELIRVGRAHYSIAKRILETPALCSNLNGMHLGSLCLNHYTLAEQIIHDQALSHVIDNECLLMLGMSHVSIAHEILDTHTLRNKLDPIRLYALGTAHFSIAERLFLDEMQNESYSTECVDLGQYHFSIAQRIMCDEHLHSKIDAKGLAILGKSHLSIALKIINDQQLLSMLNTKELTRLGEAHLTIAQQILHNNSLCSKLSNSDLISLGVAHLLIAQQIMRDEHLRNRLNCDEWCRLGEKHLAIAISIVNDESFRRRLNRGNLRKLGFSHLLIALQIIDDEMMRTKLWELDILLLGSKYRQINNIVDNQNLVDRSTISLLVVDRNLELWKEIDLMANYAAQLADNQQGINLSLKHR